MKEFTTEEIETIVKTMQSDLKEMPSQIPLREILPQGPLSRVEFSELQDEKNVHKKPKPNLDHLKVHLEVIYGSTTLTLKQLSSLEAGQVITLNEEAATPLTLRLNGKKIASGEVVSLDGKFGIKILEFEDKIKV